MFLISRCRISTGERVHAHPSCVDQRMTENSRTIDAMFIADMIIDHEIDPTDRDVVRAFLRENKQKLGEFVGWRCPTVGEIVTQARKSRERRRRETVFETIAERVQPGVTEPGEAFIADIVSELRAYAPPIDGEDACHYAARLLVAQVAWGKFEAEMEAAVNAIDANADARDDMQAEG